MSSETKETHSVISPAILYWGTPVVLVTTLNEDGSTNISPMSSAFWLGNSCMLGFGPESHTPDNLLRTRQCVLNLASDSMAYAVNRLAETTGRKEISAAKIARGYHYEKDKFGFASLTPLPSQLVRPDRVAECPVQMEAELVGVHIVGQDLPTPPGINVFEVRVLRTHVTDSIRMEGHKNRIDPDKWRPMIMSFQELYGLQPAKLLPSKLAEVNEEHYRMPPAVQRTPGNPKADVEHEIK